LLLVVDMERGAGPSNSERNKVQPNKNLGAKRKKKSFGGLQSDSFVKEIMKGSK